MRITLRYKLFLVILLANVLLTTAIVIANTRAFSSGFSTYLNEVQSRRLSPLLDTLGELYGERGDWNWLREDPDFWLRQLGRSAFGRRLPPPGDHGRPDDHNRPAPFHLKDADGRLILGDSNEAGPIVWLPIEWNGQEVGQFGVPQSLRLTAQFDRVFANQQRRQLLWIALAALLLSAAVAFPFAGRLVRPIVRLQRATHRLTKGEYDLHLPVDGGDELDDLARDFNALARTLAQNLDARQRWIADISHELRTPIAVLRAELEALLDGVRQPDDATLQSLHQEIERLGGLVADLHELSLSDAGALSYRMEPLDLADLIGEVCGHYRNRLDQGGYRLEWAAEPGTLRVQGDRNRLVQLFTNLMQNSLNYTDSTPEQPGTIRIETHASPDGVRVVWSDSAPGVPANALPRLFDRLYRVEASRNRATGGSGLGLAIVRNVVDAHGGHIEARASSLGGLSLELTLPNPGTPP